MIHVIFYMVSSFASTYLFSILLHPALFLSRTEMYGWHRPRSPALWISKGLSQWEALAEDERKVSYTGTVVSGLPLCKGALPLLRRSAEETTLCANAMTHPHLGN